MGKGVEGGDGGDLWPISYVHMHSRVPTTVPSTKFNILEVYNINIPSNKN
jgi:hypothetical protein